MKDSQRKMLGKCLRTRGEQNEKNINKESINELPTHEKNTNELSINEENTSQLPTDDEQADEIHIWGGKEWDPQNQWVSDSDDLRSLPPSDDEREIKKEGKSTKS